MCVGTLIKSSIASIFQFTVFSSSLRTNPPTLGIRGVRERKKKMKENGTSSVTLKHGFEKKVALTLVCDRQEMTN